MTTIRLLARYAPWLAALSLSISPFAVSAADQDGDGISDAVENAVGLDPTVAEFGAIHTLTEAADTTLYGIDVAEDADGNFHVVFVRTPVGDSWRDTGGPWDVQYMMVSADGEILIDEVSLNPTTNTNAVRVAKIELDANGMAVVAWSHRGVFELHLSRIDPSAAPQDGSAPSLATIEDLADTNISSHSTWKNLEFQILEGGDYLFWNAESGWMLRTDDAGAATALADISPNPRFVDGDWSRSGHGTVFGFVDENGFNVVGQYCGNSSDEMDDCVPAYALIDVDTFGYLIRPTPLQVPEFRKAHGAHYSIGHDADGNIYTTWNDKRGTHDYEYCDSCSSKSSAWFMAFDPSKLAKTGQQADFPLASDGEVRLGGRGYMQSFTDANGVTHVLYWDSHGVDYQVVTPTGEYTDVVNLADYATKPIGWRKHMNAHLAGTTLFYGETDPDQDTTATAGEYGMRLVMRSLASYSAMAQNSQVASSAGIVSFFENVAEAGLPSTDGVPENISLTDTNFRLVVTGLEPGASTTVTIDTGAALPENWRVVKYNGDDWMELAATAVSDTAFAFELTDGGAGDADGAADGMIVDPVGIGIYTAPEPAPYEEPVQVSGGGGGCVIGNGGSMDPVFPIMLMLAGAWLLRRRLNRAVFAAAALALFTLPAQAADTDGDGIADDVEISIGTNPNVPNGGAIQLTTASDALRFRPSVARDADGNFHLAFVRFEKSTSISSASYPQVMYMMIGPDGTKLIDETVINDDVMYTDTNTTNVLVDADGHVNVLWVDSYTLYMTRLDPAAAAQDGSAGDMTDTAFNLFTDVMVDNATNYYIIYSHIAANGDFLVVNHFDGEVLRFSVDDTGTVTNVFGPVIPLSNVDSAGHTGQQVAFDADDNIHFLFQDNGSIVPLMDNSPIAYAYIDGSDGTLLSDSTPIVTDYTMPPHGSHPSLNLGSDGMLYAVWGDKRGTLDENSYCSFCSQRGTSWFAVLDPSSAVTNGSVSDMTTMKVLGDVKLGVRWYTMAFIDDNDITHVFFNEYMNLDHMMIDHEGNILSQPSAVSTHSQTPNSQEANRQQVTMAGDTAFFLQSGSVDKVQAGSGLFMMKMSQSASAGDADGSVSGGRLAFLEAVADADLPDTDGLPENYELTGSNFRLAIQGVAVGGASTVTIDTGTALPENMRVLKFNGSEWQEFQFTAVSDTAFSITVVDGGAGDADGEANGVIVDPVAVAQYVAPADPEPTVVKGDGGCVMGSGGAFDPLFPMLLLLAGLYLMRRRGHRAGVLLLASAMAFAGSVQAADEEEGYLDDSKAFFTSNTYVGLTLGSPSSDAEASDITGLSTIVTVNNVAVDDGGTAYRIFFGKQVHDWISVELGFADLGDIEITADVGASDTDAFLAELAENAPVAPSGWTLDAAADYPIGDSGFSVIGNLGLFIWESDVKFGAFEHSDDGIDLHAGVGAAYKINDDFGVRLEFETFQATTKMDMFGLGVTYRF